MAKKIDTKTFKKEDAAGKKTAPARPTTKLKAAMNGKASPTKAADGDRPVFTYIASLPQPQRDIAERIDALALKTLPGLQRAVKWGMAYYGVGDGWCFSCGAFAGHVKLMFVNGATLDPVPPVTPVLKFIQEQAKQDDREAYSTLNMGAGFAIFVKAEDAERTVEIARAQGIAAWNAGVVETGPKQVLIEPLDIAYSNDDLQLR